MEIEKNKYNENKIYKFFIETVSSISLISPNILQLEAKETHPINVKTINGNITLYKIQTISGSQCIHTDL